MQHLFNFETLLFILRWFHLFFGVIWIGHLYYFNFTQTPFFGEADATTKSNVIQKLVPRALWWFRWGAMFTFLTGFVYLGIRGHQVKLPGLMSSWGVSIGLGAAIGIVMFANVWLVIWPNQKIVIQNALQTAGGGAAIPGAAERAARAGIVSRTNVLFSIPMLFFMAAASHLPFGVSAETHFGLLAAVLAVIVGAIEINALKGKMGPMASIPGVVHLGFILAAVLYAVIAVLT